jgi:hypothetical protein
MKNTPRTLGIKVIWCMRDVNLLATLLDTKIELNLIVQCLEVTNLNFRS